MVKPFFARLLLSACLIGLTGASCSHSQEIAGGWTNSGMVTGPGMSHPTPLNQLSGVFQYDGSSEVHIAPNAPRGAYSILWTYEVPSDQAVTVRASVYKANANQSNTVTVQREGQGSTTLCQSTRTDTWEPATAKVDPGSSTLRVTWSFTKPDSGGIWVARMSGLSIVAASAQNVIATAPGAAPVSLPNPMAAGFPAYSPDDMAKKPWNHTLGIHDGLLFKDDRPFFPIGFVVGPGPRLIAQMRAMDCNAVHFEIGWNQTDSSGALKPIAVSNTKQLLQLTADNGLAAFPLLAGHYVPTWFSSKFSGSTGAPLGSDGRHTGEWIPYSVHFRPFRDAMKQYWQSLAPIYASSPNVFTVNIWNEPCYGGNDEHPNVFGDYSSDSISDYHEYLRKLYNNDLNALNSAQGQNFGSFDSAQPPRSPDDMGRVAWLDWMQFGQSAFASFFDDERQAIHDVAPSLLLASKKETQPWDQSAASSGVNWHLLSRSEDVSGLDVYIGSPAMIRDIVEGGRSLCDDKPVVLYETNTMPPGAASRTPEVVRRQLWSDIIGGANGLFIYALTPDPQHGLLSDAAATPEARAEYAHFIGDVAHHQEVVESREAPARVGVLYSTTAVLQNPGTRSIPVTILQTYDLARDNGYATDFVPQGAILGGGLSKYKVLIVPSYSILKPTELEELAKWYRAGGKIICFQDSLATDELMKPQPLPGWMPPQQNRRPMQLSVSGDGRVVYIASLSSAGDMMRPVVMGALRDTFHITPDTSVTVAGRPDQFTMTALRRSYSDASTRYLMVLNVNKGSENADIDPGNGWTITREILHGGSGSTHPRLQGNQMYIFELRRG